MNRSTHWDAKCEVGGRVASSQVAFCVLLSLDFLADIGKTLKSLKFVSDMIISAC